MRISERNLENKESKNNYLSEDLLTVAAPVETNWSHSGDPAPNKVISNLFPYRIRQMLIGDRKYETLMIAI